MLIELADGFFVNPELVAAVKSTGADQCVLFTAGQSAMDGGFTLDYKASEVAQELNDALEEIFGEGDEDETPTEDAVRR